MSRRVRSTFNERTLTEIGSFGGMFAGAFPQMSEPILVASADGVGTKLKLAFALDRHDTVGIDLVAMSVNDILVQGAEPLFFLDYFACGKLDVAIATDVIKGIAQGCEQAGCALIGGETAEMPGMYPVGEYDLAGFAVGVVEKESIIDGKSIAPGDAVLGLASSGAHSNGFSLIRKIIERAKPNIHADFHGKTFREAILAPTRIFVKPMLELMKQVKVKGIAHITGGGLTENIPRVLQDGLAAIIQKSAWPRPPLFSWLQEHGNVAESEMHRVFNCGVGMVVVVDSRDASAAMKFLQHQGETVWQIGSIAKQQAGQPQTIVV